MEIPDDEHELNKTASFWKRVVDINETIHEPVRFGIMSFLHLHGKASFSTLQSVLDLTAGNLSSHIKKLEKAGYIEIEKKFVDSKPRTIIYLTKEGERVFVEYAKKMLDSLSRLISDFEEK